MKVFTKLMFGLVLLMSYVAANAQTNIANYTFSQSTGSSFTPLTNDSTAFSGSYDDAVSGAVSLGGTFTFGGVAYTQCYISTNGFITFGAAPSSTSYTPLSTLGSTTGAIAAFGADGASSTVTGATSRISYAIVGDEFVIQYLDHATFNGRSTERVNFQIRINRSTNTVNFVYGTFTSPGSAYSPQVGIRGASTDWATNVNNLLIGNIPSGTTCNWASAVTGNANSSTMFYSTVNANVVPPLYLSFTWRPATSPTPVRTFRAVTNITTNSAIISWAPATGATQYNVQYRVIGTCTWTNFSSPISDTLVNLTGLAVGTTYQIRVQSVSGSAASIWSHIPTSAGGTGTNGYIAAGTFTTTVLCPVPASVAAGSITTTSASVSFTPTSGSFILEYGATGFTPGTGATAGTGGTIITGTASPIALAGLTPSTTYQVYVRQNCTAAGNGYSTNSSVVSFTTAAVQPVNDSAAGAITLAVGPYFGTTSYTNVAATQAANEKFASCYQSATTGTGVTIATHTMWFKFVAPVGGAVKVSTDTSAGTLSDTHLGLFSATNASDYNTFNIISCDDDNGAVSSLKSIMYATGLVPGQTYYISVDGYSGATGTYYLAVSSLTSSMLATTATCTSTTQTPSGTQTSYAGQVPMVDVSGNLIALVQNPAGGSVSAYSVSQNVNTGAVRNSQGTYYLDRNFRISNSASAANVNVQLFFLTSELTALQAVDPLITLANIGVTRQIETTAGCSNNFDTARGPISFIAQSGNGTAGQVSWINFTTPGFSNFYLHRNGTALPIKFEYLTGKKAGSTNALNWKVTCTSTSITMVLERSADARTFNQTVTSINATQARCGQPFDAVDAAPLNGISYYRLKMIDVDGKVSYSPVAAVLNGKAGAELVGIYPTVVKDQAYLSITSSRNTTMQFSISDVSGKVIKTINQAVSSGSAMLPISTSNLASGVYNISGMLDGVRTQTLRFVKQ